MDKQREGILKRLECLEAEINALGWDTQASDLADVRRSLQCQWVELDRFHAMHPKNEKGQFIKRET